MQNNIGLDADLKIEYPQLKFLRVLIDNTDSAILAVLAYRAYVVNYIVEFKSIHQIDIPKSRLREEGVDELLEFSAKLSLSPSFVKNLLEHLFTVSGRFLQMPSQPWVHEYFLDNTEILSELTQSLKNFDMSFCSLLAERMQLVKRVGEFKNSHNIPTMDQSRWEQVLASKLEIAEHLKINKDAIKGLYTIIHKEALKIESSTSLI